MEVQRGSGLALMPRPLRANTPVSLEFPNSNNFSSSFGFMVTRLASCSRWLVRRGHQSMVVSLVPMAPARGRSRLMWSMGFIRSWPMLLSPWAKSAALLLLRPWAD